MLEMAQINCYTIALLGIWVIWAIDYRRDNARSHLLMLAPPTVLMFIGSVALLISNQLAWSSKEGHPSFHLLIWFVTLFVGIFSSNLLLAAILKYNAAVKLRKNQPSKKINRCFQTCCDCGNPTTKTCCECGRPACTTCAPFRCRGPYLCRDCYDELPHPAFTSGEPQTSTAGLKTGAQTLH